MPPRLRRRDLVAETEPLDHRDVRPEELHTVAIVHDDNVPG